MKHQALGVNILLEIPYESRYMKAKAGEPDIKLTTLKLSNVPLTIVSRGEQVKESLQVGDQVLLFLGEGQGVNVIELEGIEYIFIQDFDIQIKVNKNKSPLMPINALNEFLEVNGANKVD